VRIDGKRLLQLLKNPDFDVLSASLQLTFNLLQSELVHPVIRLSEQGQDIISSEFLQTLFIKLQSMSIKVKICCYKSYVRLEAFVMTTDKTVVNQKFWRTFSKQWRFAPNCIEYVEWVMLTSIN
jgi:hypothetical protein